MSLHCLKNFWYPISYRIKLKYKANMMILGIQSLWFKTGIFLYLFPQPFQPMHISVSSMYCTLFVCIFFCCLYACFSPLYTIPTNKWIKWKDWEDYFFRIQLMCDLLGESSLVILFKEFYFFRNLWCHICLYIFLSLDFLENRMFMSLAVVPIDHSWYIIVNEEMNK